jgi:hypothetical protein
LGSKAVIALQVRHCLKREFHTEGRPAARSHLLERCVSTVLRLILNDEAISLFLLPSERS